MRHADPADPNLDDPDDEEVKLYMVADDEFMAEFCKSNRFLAVDYYEGHFDSGPEHGARGPGHYTGSNWNEMEEGPMTSPVVEERVLNDVCLVCFEKFKENEKVSKWRCGHCFCLGCAAAM